MNWLDGYGLVPTRIDLPLVDHSVTGGPKVEIALRLLSDEVLDCGDSMVSGSVRVTRNRHRGQWRPGWVASCKAVHRGQSHGLGQEVALPPHVLQEQMLRAYQMNFQLDER